MSPEHSPHPSSFPLWAPDAFPTLRALKLFAEHLDWNPYLDVIVDTLRRLPRLEDLAVYRARALGRAGNEQCKLRHASRSCMKIDSACAAC